MSQPNLSHELSAIWFSFFNHTEFLQHEIKDFVNNFETRRGDIDVDQLFVTLEKVTDSKDIQISRAVQAAQNNLPNIQVNLPKALAKAQTILNLETEISKVN